MLQEQWLNLLPCTITSKNDDAYWLIKRDIYCLEQLIVKMSYKGHKRVSLAVSIADGIDSYNLLVQDGWEVEFESISNNLIVTKE